MRCSEGERELPSKVSSIRFHFSEKSENQLLDIRRYVDSSEFTIRERQRHSVTWCRAQVINIAKSSLFFLLLL